MHKLSSLQPLEESSSKYMQELLIFHIFTTFSLKFHSHKSWLDLICKRIFVRMHLFDLFYKHSAAFFLFVQHEFTYSCDKKVWIIFLPCLRMESSWRTANEKLFRVCDGSKGIARIMNGSINLNSSQSGIHAVKRCCRQKGCIVPQELLHHKCETNTTMKALKKVNWKITNFERTSNRSNKLNTVDYASIKWKLNLIITCWHSGNYLGNCTLMLSTNWQINLLVRSFRHHNWCELKISCNIKSQPLAEFLKLG